MTRAPRGGYSQGWLKKFVNYYLGYKQTYSLGESCALPSLSGDVMRADNETRGAYTEELKYLVGEIAAGLPEDTPIDREGGSRDDRAILLLALLTGGATLARAVSDPALSEKIAGLVTTEALHWESSEA